MEIIKRLAELREEHNDLQRGRGEVMVKIIELEAELERAEKGKRDRILDRFKTRQPLTLGSLEDKIGALSTELDEHRSIVEAIDSKLAEIRPVVVELEEMQRLADGWHGLAIMFVTSRILTSKLRGKVDQAVQAARPQVFRQDIYGKDIVEKSIPANTGGSLPFYIRQCESEVLKAARKIDPSRYPRFTEVDLMAVDQGFGYDPRRSRQRDRRILDDIWAEYLSVEQRLREEYGVDIGPTAEEVSQKIAEVIPSAPTPPYH